MSLNSRLSTAKNNRSPYEAYNGKVSKATADFIVDGHLLREAEYGQVAVQQVMHVVAEKDPNLLSKVEDLNELISQADAIWDKEDTLTTDEEQTSYDAESLLLELHNKCVEKVLQNATDNSKSCTMTATGESNDSKMPATKKRKATRSGTPEQSERNKRQSRPPKKFSATEDTPDRKIIRDEMREAQVKQAEKVNRRRAKLSKDRKDPLEVGDICTVSTAGVKKEPFKYLHVMITSVDSDKNTVQYCFACKDGTLNVKFGRNDLMHRKKIHKRYTINRSGCTSIQRNHYHT